jgi:hypothetical protein
MASQSPIIQASAVGSRAHDLIPTFDLDTALPAVAVG